MFVCLGLSLFALGVTHELGWSVHLVLGPGHAFTRWDDGKGTQVNMDQGVHKTDAEYMKLLTINPLTVTRKGYLVNLTRDHLVATALYTLITYKAMARRSHEALAEATTAVALHPTSPIAHEAHGIVLSSKGEYTKAIAAYDKTLYYDPNRASVYYFRGMLHQRLGDTAKATLDYDKAKALDPTEEYKKQVVTHP